MLASIGSIQVASSCFDSRTASVAAVGSPAVAVAGIPAVVGSLVVVAAVVVGSPVVVAVVGNFVEDKMAIN